MQVLDVMALAPPGGRASTLAIAACRARARGGLDLEFTRDLDLARAEMEYLARFTAGPFGVKLGREAGPLIDLLLTQPYRLAWVTLAGGDSPDLAAWLERFHKHGVEVLLEATSLPEIELAECLGVDGLVLKGQEAGGRIGPDTSFILLQRWHARRAAGGPNLPAWVHGGVGLNTAAACAAGGATGIVLDAQLLLAREASLRESARLRLATFDGSETVCLGESLGESYRFYSRPGLIALDQLRREEKRLADEDLPPAERLAAWRRAVAERIGGEPEIQAWPLGQDGAFARPLAERYSTVAGIIRALSDGAARQLESARRLQPLAEGAPLARRQGTRYPIVQGPMTRVSDTSAFANAVAGAGALPFLALALLRQSQADKLLSETKARLGDRPWGAGILGFAPPDVRREQTAAIRSTKPPFALIAGGRPDQARELEKEGIPTYLHVPSPGLLRMFLRDGASRFIFEGRECGGHVGPRSSFVLWETMCDVLLEHLGATGKGEPLSVLFAGGIHDGVSAAMVAALAAGLAERGVAIGVLLGTAYLFTEEAVTNQAIVPQFQREALNCRDTVLLETGPGHAIRCVPTPYQETFEREKRRLLAEGRSHDEVREALEALNIGRLRIASKGRDRVPAAGNGRKSASELVDLTAEVQRREGMYMIGQVASLRDRVVTMAELHEEVSPGSQRHLLSMEPLPERERPAEEPLDIAVIGMGCHFPMAPCVRAYWQNTLARVDAITEVPPDHWDWRLYYDPDPKAKGKISSKWGGFLGDVAFDPLAYGMPPNSLRSIEPVQLYLLDAVRRALADAGYAQRPFDRGRTAVVLGAGGGAAQLSMSYGLKSYLPLLETVPGLRQATGEIIRRADQLLPEWTEDSFPGILLNVAAGRVANRFDLGGPNFTVDAACGSSLAALYVGVRELEQQTSDMVLVMGADTVQNPFTYMLFSKTQAFSPRGHCSAFDEAADGIVISEGVGVVVLKRLADAERDGDRIYAVIRGVGASSDGKDKGLTAPRPEGQLRALRRAYAKAGISPARVRYVEAHGTGTAVGDQTEAQSLSHVFREAGALPRGCVLGSVKSMIGHTKCAAGLAGLINAVLALHHKAVPPLLIERPNSKANFPQTPFYLNTEPRPWLAEDAGPRCAGVSAFGFGGTNFHAVLEEYTGDYLQEQAPAFEEWPAELFVIRRSSSAEILKAAEECRKGLAALRTVSSESQGWLLRDLAYTLGTESSDDAAHPVLALVATSPRDLEDKLSSALSRLQAEEEHFQDPSGFFFSARPAGGAGKVAFLFPGQGSQYPNMLAQAALAFPEVRGAFDEANRALAGRLERPLGTFIFPPSAFSPEEEKQARQELTRTDVAQPAIGAASVGLLRLLGSLGLTADYLAGHSYGDYVALHAAGALDAGELFRLSHERGRVIREATERMPGAMAAIEADRETVEKVLIGLESVTAANLNAPRQTVISGTASGIEQALARFQEQEISGQRLAVGCGFHSPLVGAARAPFAEALAACTFAAPQVPVFANTTAAPYPTDPTALCALLAEHITSPVRFQEEIEALYEAGVQTFIEVGPQGILTALVGQILAGRPHLAVASDQKGRQGLVQLSHLLGQLVVHGLPLRLARLFVGRAPRLLDLKKLEQEITPKLSASTWIVSSARVRPLDGPEPLYIGPTRPTAAAEEPVPELVPAATRATLNKPAVEPVPPAAALTAAPSPSTPSSNGHAAVPPIAPTAILDEAAQVMLRFQDMMARFLDTQRSVMTSYFQGSPAPAAPPIPELPVAAPTNGRNGHHPNGHHTNGHAVPLASVAPVNTAPPQSAAQTVSPEPAVLRTAVMDRESLTARLLEIVGKRTGYPAAMLGLDLDLEADLGIDSIKRVEILGSLGEAGSQAVEGQMEQLTAIKTLRGIIDCLLQKQPNGSNGHAKPIATPHVAAALDRDSLTARLLEIVGKRTGYPAAMLGLDLDLEADLGIDSIKRVEILGILGEAGGQAVEGQMEQLTAIKTLRGIIDCLLQKQPNGSNGHAAPRNKAPSPARTRTSIQRMIVEPIDAPQPAENPNRLPGGTLIVTDDGRGVARELVRCLAHEGQDAVLVRMGLPGTNGSSDNFAADLTDARAVNELLEKLHREVGPISGLIHLLPLAEPPAGEEWIQRMRREVKSLFLLARGLADELSRRGDDRKAVLLAATAMGGCFGTGANPLPAQFFPGQGGVAGLVKSLAHEWPAVQVRVVDLDWNGAAGVLAQHVRRELGDAEGPVEVGYQAGRRVTLACRPAPLDSHLSPALVIDHDTTILITGGARGITAAVAQELAERYRPNLVLVGRSAVPAEQEESDTAGLSVAAELKAALMARLRREGRPVTPAAVEMAYHRLQHDREIRANLARLRKTGAQVHYYQADVRDEHEFTGVIQSVYQRFGRLDGVIHGAGVIQDKLIRDKTPESYDLVFDTKVDSALILARHVRPEQLRFCVFFASVAGRFGNRGQSDYAAANDVLSKLAVYLDRHASGRTVSVVWGPWSGIGMVSDLERHLGQRGLQMIPPDVGPRMLVEELCHGAKGDAEVVIAGDVGQLALRREPKEAVARAEVS
jgi:acyl transferase domain-containing protein/NAD(P)H-dependent flavin oxidoreductase YrpB (nitropropane dioxygenase family)/acyl carrier protein